MVLVQLGLSNANGFVEVVVGQDGIQNGVALLLEKGRLEATRCRLPAVKKEDRSSLGVSVSVRRLGLRAAGSWPSHRRQNPSAFDAGGSGV